MNNLIHKNYIAALAIGMALLTSITSCKKKDPDIPQEEELITTLTLTLTPDGGGDNVVLKFQDLDGDGGDAPVLTEDALAANTTYSASVELLNETEDPAGDITTEVRTEGTDHQLFYQISNANLTSSYTDEDGDGNPIGLETTMVTGDASTGQLTVTLRHQPDKSATNVSAGEITNAGGETDIEVQFEITIE